MKKQGLVSLAGASLLGIFGYLVYKWLKKKPKLIISEARLHSKRRKTEELNEIEKRLDDLKLNTSALKQLMELFELDLEKGLNRLTNSEANLRMLPTYVYEIPNNFRNEKHNNILALDLGGSNFRISLIDLPHTTHHKVFLLSERIIKGSGEQLFDYLSNCLAQFMKCQSLDLTKEYSLGFTFSFPCHQTNISKAILLRWTKGFNCSNTIGNNIVELLQNSINKRGDIKVKVVALINDTVGTLMSCAYEDKNTCIGFIVGTGANACYFEHINKIGTLSNHDDLGDNKFMIVNTELGAFGENGCIDFIRTRYDDEIDSTSINVGMQIFEKMISSMYLGELVRLIILDLIDCELILKEEMKQVSYRHALFTKGTFYSKYINEIEFDNDLTYSITKRIMIELTGASNISDDDCAVIKYICELVSERTAKLTAVALAVLLNRIKRKQMTISVDGGMFRFHKKLLPRLEKTLRSLVNPELDFKITFSIDGSGRGAAVVAALAST